MTKQLIIKKKQAGDQGVEERKKNMGLAFRKIQY
jgi:hypothetical protein